MFRTISLLILLSPSILFAQSSLKLIDQPVKLANNLSFNLKIPQGYIIHVAAEGLKRPRFFAKSPDGRLFVTDMYDRSDNKKGRVLILENWNDTTKRFTKISVYLDSLHNPNQVAFYQDKGQWKIYVAETGKLSYYTYTAGSTRSSGKGTVIAQFPDYGLSYKYGGWHLTRSIAVYNKKLYVSVGSSCDACIEKEDMRAVNLEMDPDGSNQRFFARGLRNAVGLKWVNAELWATNMGRDNSGPDKPEDLLHPVKFNDYFGWPFYFQYKKKILNDPSFKDSVQPSYIKRPVVAPWAFKAHSAPLGLEYVTGFTDSLLNNSFIVALHGSTSVWRQRGNAVVQMLPGGSYRDIVTGFLQGKNESQRYGRPCDVIQWDNRSLFISDDKNGVIYFLTKP